MNRFLMCQFLKVDILEIVHMRVIIAKTMNKKKIVVLILSVVVGVEVNYNKKNESILKEIVKIVVIVEAVETVVVVDAENVEVEKCKEDEGITSKTVKLVVIVEEAVVDAENVEVSSIGL